MEVPLLPNRTSHGAVRWNIEGPNSIPGVDIAMNYFLVAALSGLTGIRASIPIFGVALGSKLFENFPLELQEDFGWLREWHTIFGLGLLIVLEVVGDCIPCVDAAMDSVMLFLKPALSVLVSSATKWEEPAHEAIASVTSLAVSIPVATGKMALDGAVIASTAGIGTPLRSCTEDILVVVLLVLSFMIPVTVLIILAFFLYWMYVKTRKLGRFVAKKVKKTRRKHAAERAAEQDGGLSEPLSPDSPEPVGSEKRIADLEKRMEDVEKALVDVRRNG
mmetsp:Transcript_61508/g.133090  ORF Transcript_61508/g.133090 Transcript_61508/m.133090 type:complete len:276 (+) Transcript_61508:83-910(+)